MDSWTATGIRTIANCETDWWDKKTRISEVRRWHIHTEHSAVYEWECWIQTCDRGNINSTSRGARHGNAAYSDRQPPPEVTERSIREALASYWEIVSIQVEIWSKAYRYKVAKGVKAIMMKLAKHLPPRMKIAGHRALPSMTASQLHVIGVGTVDI
jgi:hypothetical protein